MSSLPLDLLSERELCRPFVEAGSRRQTRTMALSAGDQLDWRCPNRAELRRFVASPWLAVVSKGPIQQLAPLRSMHVAGAPIADPERAFLEHLPVIDRIVALIARRHLLSASDADDFSSWAKSRVIDAEYAIFRKFGGRSSMATYLSAVFAHLFLDYRNSIWGRWRPSAAASRLGPVGVRLDELLHRDGYSLREAREVLRSAGVTETDVDLGRMAAQLPVRQASTEVSLDAIERTAFEAAEAPGDIGPDDAGLHVLRDALDALPAEDRVIVRMRFWDDRSVADIARLLRIEQKPLYRRIEAIEDALRELLSARGMDKDGARELLSREVAW